MDVREPEKEKAAEGQIVDDIIKHAKIIDGDVALYYGSKALGVRITDPTKFETVIGNVPGANEKKDKQTRLLYMAAKKIMQREVDKAQRIRVYQYETFVPSMIEFAKDDGQKIFEWDDGSLGTVVKDGNNSEQIFGIKAEKTFIPEIK